MWSETISFISSPVFPSYKNNFLSDEPETNKSPDLLNLIVFTKFVCYLLDLLNLKGGPSYHYNEYSSPPTTNL